MIIISDQSMIPEIIDYELFKISRALSEENLSQLYKRMEYKKMSPQEQIEYLIKNHWCLLKKNLNNIKSSNDQLSEEQKRKIRELEKEIQKQINKENKKVWNLGKAPTAFTGDYLLNIKKQCKENYLNSVKQQAIDAGLSETVANYYIIETLITKILSDIGYILDKKTSNLSKNPLTINQKKIISKLIKKLSNFAKSCFTEDNISFLSQQSNFLGENSRTLISPNMVMYDLLSVFATDLEKYFKFNDNQIKNNIQDIKKIKSDNEKEFYHLLNPFLESELQINQKLLFAQVYKIFDFGLNDLDNSINKYDDTQTQNSQSQENLPPSYVSVMKKKYENFIQNIFSSPIGVTTSAQSEEEDPPLYEEAIEGEYLDFSWNSSSSSIGLATAAQSQEKATPSYESVTEGEYLTFSRNISSSPIGVTTSAQGASGIIPNPAEALSSPIGVATSAQSQEKEPPSYESVMKGEYLDFSRNSSSSSIGLATSAQGASGIIPNPAEALSSPIEDEVMEKMLAEIPTPPTNSPYNVRRRTDEARQGLQFPSVKF